MNAAEELTHLIRIARADALKEAASICRQVAADWKNNSDMYLGEPAAQDCAERIMALASS